MADLGSLLEKLGRSAGLQNSEIAQLRSKGTALDRLSGSSNTLLDLPYTFDVDYLSARHGVFGEIPLESCRLGTNTDQLIANDTVTILKPADALAGSGPSFTHGIEVDTTLGRINLGKFDSPSIFLLFTWLQWDTNSTGVRTLRLYDADAGTENVTLDGRVANGFTHNQSMYLWRNSGTNGDNLELRVDQNSGGDLSVLHWRFGAVRVH